MFDVHIRHPKILTENVRYAYMAYSSVVGGLFHAKKNMRMHELSHGDFSVQSIELPNWDFHYQINVHCIPN